MTLLQLANFVRVAEVQNVSKAAALVRVAQPALSRQIRSLEAEFGTPLLVRHAWGVSLTAAGELLVQHARRLLRDAQAAKDVVQALAAEPSGPVAVGVPGSVSSSLLPSLAVALRNDFPLLRPHFIDGFSAALHARALSGDLDVALLYAAPNFGPLNIEPLLEEELMLVGPADARVVPAPVVETLRDRSLILPARPNRLRLIVDSVLSDETSGARILFEVDSLTAIAGMVENGAGFTVLPYSTVAGQVERGSLSVWPLTSPTLSRTLVLATPFGKGRTAAVDAVIGEVSSIVHRQASALRWRPLSEARKP